MKTFEWVESPSPIHLLNFKVSIYHIFSRLFITLFLDIMRVSPSHGQLSHQSPHKLISTNNQRLDVLTSLNSNKALMVSNPPDYEKSAPKLGSSGMSALLYEKETVI